MGFLKDEVGDLGKDEDPGEQDDGVEQALWDRLCHPPCCSGGASLYTFITEVEFVHPVSAGGSVKFLPAV